MSDSAKNLFSDHPLERVSHLRTDETWLAEKIGHADSLVVPIWRGKPFVMRFDASGMPSAQGKAELGFVRLAMLMDEIEKGAPMVLLGIDGKDRAYFALGLDPESDPENRGPLAGMGSFAEPRMLAMELPKGDPALLSHAVALLNWHGTHRFCSACGTQTVMADAGYKRTCPGCGMDHFPRTDPVVIMLVEKDDRALLGRSAHFPDTMFSALAGFVEPGESLEEAVAREVMEEAGVLVKAVKYHSTQPWPFPYSLMIGCHAIAETETITLTDDELVEARWFSRDEVKKAMRGEHPQGLFVPPPFAIAHHLIRAWADEEH